MAEPRRNASVPGVIVGLALAGALLSGCAGGAADVDRDPTRDVYPKWVRMVPTPTERATYYVASCSEAPSLDQGIALAISDVSQEISTSERARFFRLFDKALKDARSRTTPIERRRFRNEGSEIYAARTLDFLVREDTYYRPCAEGGNAVCSVFVLLRLEHADRDAALETTVNELRDAFREEGNSVLVEVAERMLRSTD